MEHYDSCSRYFLLSPLRWKTEATLHLKLEQIGVHMEVLQTVMCFLRRIWTVHLILIHFYTVKLLAVTVDKLY